MYLNHYNCISAAGVGPNALWEALSAGHDFGVLVEENTWSHSVVAGGRVCFLPDVVNNSKFYASIEERLQKHLSGLLESYLQNLSDEETQALKKKRVLISLASTKGILEDYIWQFKNNSKAVREQDDPFTAIKLFLHKNYSANFGELEIQAVSNACASSHVAIELTKKCLDAQICDLGIVLAFDLIGPFIYRGFQSLKILSPTKCRPFSDKRDGLQLGEACALLVFSNKKYFSDQSLQIAGVATETQGGSVTRPSHQGVGLLKAMQTAKKQATSARAGKMQQTPDFGIAHGTGTVFNDDSEADAIAQFTSGDENFVFTGIKWSIGHTLGASGAMDLIAASEILKRQKLFSLANTEASEKKMNSQYYYRDRSIEPKPLRLGLVSSLGFGGVHAALLLERT